MRLLLIFVGLSFLCSNSYAQSPLAFNISCFVNSSAAASTSSFGGYSETMREGAVFSYQQSRLIYGSDEQFYYNLHKQEYNNDQKNFPLGKMNAPAAPVFIENRFRGDYKDMKKWIEEERKRIKK
jgi:hypothetical protein